MATYVIGDVQGCCDSLEALVAKLPFDAAKDRLWFVGDLVNRGPKSRQTLHRIMAAGRRAVAILGNHDLHLLATAAGVRKPLALDTLDDVLNADDRNELIDWVRTRPLAHAQGNTLMVHAGVLPQWSAKKTIALAGEVSQRLASDHWKDFMHEMYGNTPAHWSDGLRHHERLRVIVNVLTRIRYLNADQSLELVNKNAPRQAPASLTPWFSARNRQTKNHQLIFGHWSTLGLINRANLIALDTGCVWGGRLSCVRLEDRKVFWQKSLEGNAGEE